MRDASATSLEQELLLLGGAEGVSSIESLSGGVIAAVWLVGYADGSRLVAKMLEGPGEDTFGLEVEGLEALRATGTVTVPEV